MTGGVRQTVSTRGKIGICAHLGSKENGSIFVGVAASRKNGMRGRSDSDNDGASIQQTEGKRQWIGTGGGCT